MDLPRRGLPPPSTSLPPLDIVRPAAGATSQLPPPPSHWQSTDEAMRQWLQAKAEEDRRKQEEEKTRQEGLRLEQRRIEQSMLRDSFQAGVPPHMIPLIFSGFSGASRPSSTLEPTQQYVVPDMHYPPPPQPPYPQGNLFPPPAPPPPPSSGEIRRDSRSIPPNPYAAQPGQQPAIGVPQPNKFVSGSVANRSFGHSPMLSGPTDSKSSSLSRLTATEAPVLSGSSNGGSGSYASGTPLPSTTSHFSTSISFHHWVPPGQSQPNTPSAKSQQGTPSTAQTPHSHLRLEHQSSPGRKRKAQGVHQPAPTPSSLPSDTSNASQPPLVPSASESEPVTGNSPASSHEQVP